MEAGEFNPSREFPILAKIGELTSLFASGLKPENDGGLRPGRDCRLAGEKVILSQTHPRCNLIVTEKIGPGKDDIEKVVMKVIPGTRASVYQVNDRSNEVNDHLYGLCKLPVNKKPQVPTLFILFKQKKGKAACKLHKDLSKPVTVPIDNYSPCDADLSGMHRFTKRADKNKVQINFCPVPRWRGNGR